MPTSETMPTSENVITRRDGRLGRMILDRPRALNALDLPMVRTMISVLREWEADPAVHAVTVEGAGGRAFCAGGDIRNVQRHASAGEHDAVEEIFAGEYELSRIVAEYAKPYIALVDGFCMGAGMGVSIHGSARVASEAAAFAMPEVRIALFPDVGAGYFLPRLPGALGMYMALTGARITGADAVHAGLATHYVPRDGLPALSAELAEDGPAALARHAAPLPPFTLAPHRAAIDRCFSAPSVIGIVRRLEAEPSDWARETLAALRGASPSAVLWSFEHVCAGARRTLRQSLAAELALTRTVTRHPDFIEGVRAVLIDKDQQPRWTHPRIEDVDPGEIAAMSSGRVN